MRIGTLRFTPPKRWTFYPFDQIILAERDSGAGRLQISMAFRHDLPEDASPEACQALAKTFVSRPGMSDMFDTTEASKNDSLFGGLSFTVGTEFGRVWYHFVDGQLILGTFGCSQEKLDLSELDECERIMLSARYAS